MATYKLALLRSLCDISQHETAIVKWDAEGKVYIPISALSEKWIEYYWPIVASDFFVPQIGGENPQSKKPISFRKSLSELVVSYAGSGGFPGFAAERDAGLISPASKPIHKTVLTKVKNAIKKPVYYAGGGDSTNKPFQYDKSTRSILIDGQLWREFSLLGYLIRDSVILRWAEETNRMSKQEVEVSTALELLLSSFCPERDVVAARNVLNTQKSIECVWSGKSIRKFDIDHAIPFSLWRDNSLWNLLPVAPAVNNAKRAKLPSINLLSERKDALIYCWEMMKDAHGNRFQQDAGKIVEAGGLHWNNWKELLFSGFVEAVETTAVRRGVERWEV